MGLNKALLTALAATGYEKPTPIQAKAIPDVMAGKDLLGIAQTGTGKTAAFALPILHRLAENRTPPAPRTTRALILSPTRELATQIGDSFKAYGAHLGFRVAVIFGGVKYGAQERALQQGLDILVAAPGRLLDHIQQKNLDLSSTEIFVLDEADQMLDLGFIKPIRQIVSRIPAKRQNLFFSATMPSEIGKLAGELLKDPVKVQVTPQATTVGSPSSPHWSAYRRRWTPSRMTGPPRDLALMPASGPTSASMPVVRSAPATADRRSDNRAPPSRPGGEGA